LETIHVCQLVGYYGYGGVNSVAMSLSQALSKFNGGKYNVTYLCRNLNMKQAKEHRFNIVELKPSNTYALWKLLEKQDKYDIIHCHDIYALPGLLRRSEDSSEKYVYTHHGIVPLEYTRKKDYPGSLFAKRCGKKGIRNMDMNIAISRYIMDDLRKNFESKNNIIIPNGVDLNRLDELGTCSSRTNTMSGNPKLLCVSILDRQKGHEFLIRSMVSIRKEYPGADLTIVGKGRLEGQLRRLVSRLGLDGCVTLTGYLPEPELYRYYHDCDVLMVPSYCLYTILFS